MKFHTLNIEDAFLLEFLPIADNRGSFTRVFCADTLAEQTNFKTPVKHVNHSVTVQKGSIRGLHYQIAPAMESKVVRCLKGRIFDVMVDLRKDSKTFMQVQTKELSGDDPYAVIIPEGVAHGFQTLKENTEIMYMTATPYNKTCERSIHYNDPLFNINWLLEVTNISEHDKNIPYLDNSFKGL